MSFTSQALDYKSLTLSVSVVLTAESSISYPVGFWENHHARTKPAGEQNSGTWSGQRFVCIQAWIPLDVWEKIQGSTMDTHKIK